MKLANGQYQIMNKSDVKNLLRDMLAAEVRELATVNTSDVSRFAKVGEVRKLSVRSVGSTRGASDAAGEVVL